MRRGYENNLVTHSAAVESNISSKQEPVTVWRLFFFLLNTKFENIFRIV